MRTTILIIAAFLIFAGFKNYSKEAASLEKAQKYIEVLEEYIDEDYLLDVISETDEYTDYYSDNSDRFNLYLE